MLPVCGTPRVHQHLPQPSPAGFPSLRNAAFCFNHFSAMDGVCMFVEGMVSLSLIGTAPPRDEEEGGGLKLERDWPVPVGRPGTGCQLGQLHSAQLPRECVQESAEIGLGQGAGTPRAVQGLRKHTGFTKLHLFIFIKTKSKSKKGRKEKNIFEILKNQFL